MKHEGIAGNDVHSEWLDQTLDRCVMYLAGRDKNLVKGLGGDDEFIQKAMKYFAGTVMEARRLLEPDDDGEQDDESSDGSEA